MIFDPIYFVFILPALALTDEAADPVGAAFLHSREGYLQWAQGDSTTALAAHREAVPAAELRQGCRQKLMRLRFSAALWNLVERTAATHRV